MLWREASSHGSTNLETCFSSNFCLTLLSEGSGPYHVCSMSVRLCCDPDGGGPEDMLPSHQGVNFAQVPSSGGPHILGSSERDWTREQVGKHSALLFIPAVYKVPKKTRFSVTVSYVVCSLMYLEEVVVLISQRHHRLCQLSRGEETL
jgi:hypothetical protein